MALLVFCILLVARRLGERIWRLRRALLTIMFPWWSLEVRTHLPRDAPTTRQGRRFLPWEEKAPFWEEKEDQTNTKYTREGCVPLEGFVSIQSKDPPYLRGKDFIVWESTPGWILLCLCLYTRQGLSKNRTPCRWGLCARGDELNASSRLRSTSKETSLS